MYLTHSLPDQYLARFAITRCRMPLLTYVPRCTCTCVQLAQLHHDTSSQPALASCSPQGLMRRVANTTFTYEDAVQPLGVSLAPLAQA